MYLIVLVVFIIVNYILFSILGFNNVIIMSLLLSCNGMLLLIIIKELIEILVLKIKYKKIIYNNLDKFLYFRELLKDYSISELGMIYNKRVDINTLISLEFVNLIRKEIIKIDNNNITIVNKEKLNYIQKYILDSLKFIDLSEVRKKLKKKIKSNLIEKQFFNKLNNEIDFKIIYVCTLIFLFAYIGAIAIDTEGLFIFVITMISFFAFWVELVILMVILSQYSIKVRTKKGQEIYLKLVGLKNYLKDFSNFEDKKLQEIYLWEEYILYAVILNESKTIKKESLDLFEKISDGIINGSLKIID